MPLGPTIAALLQARARDVLPERFADLMVTRGYPGFKVAFERPKFHPADQHTGYPRLFTSPRGEDAGGSTYQLSKKFADILRRGDGTIPLRETSVTNTPNGEGPEEDRGRE